MWQRLAVHEAFFLNMAVGEGMPLIDLYRFNNRTGGFFPSHGDRIDCWVESRAAVARFIFTGYLKLQIRMRRHDTGEFCGPNV